MELIKQKFEAIKQRQAQVDANVTRSEAELKKVNQEAESKRSVVLKLEEELNGIEQSLAEIESEYDDFKVQLDETEKDLEEEKRSSNFGSGYASKQNKFGNLEKIHLDLTNEKDRIQQNILGLEQELETLEVQLNTNEEEVTEKEEIIRQLEASLIDISNELRSKEHVFGATQSKSSKFTKLIDDLNKKIRDEREKGESLVNHIYECENEIASLETEIEDVKFNLKEKKDELEKLANELAGF